MTCGHNGWGIRERGALIMITTGRRYMADSDSEARIMIVPGTQAESGCTRALLLPCSAR
jgi:hypothetical protein